MSMRNDPLMDLKDDEPVLTAGALRGVRAKVEEKREQVESLRRDLSVAERALEKEEGKLAVVYELLGLSDAPIARNAAPKKTKITWATEVLRAVQQSERGFLSYEGIREALRNGPLAEKLARTDKSFHGAVAKLHESGDLVRHNEHAFMPDVYQEHMEKVRRGQTEDVRPQNPARRSPLQDCIVEALEAADQELAGSDIIKFIIRSGPSKISRSVRNSPNGVYNALGRMTDRGDLVKNEEEKTYRLPKKGDAENEISPSSEDDEETAGEAATSLNGSTALYGALL